MQMVLSFTFFFPDVEVLCHLAKVFQINYYFLLEEIWTV